MDSVPFDLVEGLQFEKIFYPAALAIYFTEGVPQKKQRAKDRRVTASSTGTAAGGGGGGATTSKKNPASRDIFSEKRGGGKPNVFLKAKSHKRLGIFNLGEGDKLCRQFGGKTIRIINAEDVERDTMEFLNELVQRNLNKYPDILEGKAVLDFGGGGDGGMLEVGGNGGKDGGYDSASFMVETPQETEEEQERQLEQLSGVVRRRLEEEPKIPGVPGENGKIKENMPPPLVTAINSDTSVFTLPPIFNSSCEGSARGDEVMESGRLAEGQLDRGGGGDQDFILEVPTPPEEKDRGKSAELWERIMKLESRVAMLKTKEEELICPVYPPHLEEGEEEGVREEEEEILLPPPTAYKEEEDGRSSGDGEEDQEIYTQAIRNAIGRGMAFGGVGGEEMEERRCLMDYGAMGDSAEYEDYRYEEQYSLDYRRRQKQEKKKKTEKYPPFENDPFYDN